MTVNERIAFFYEKHLKMTALAFARSLYVNVCRMLSGDLKTVVDTDKLNISLLQNAIPFFKGKKAVSVLALLVTVHGFVSVCPLHKVSSLPQMLMGQIAQNRCYTLARQIQQKLNLEHKTKFLLK